MSTYDLNKLAAVELVKDTAEKFKTKHDALASRVSTLENESIKTVKVDGTALTQDANHAVNVVLPTYAVAELATATEGYLKSYVLQKTVGSETTQVGTTINIPKDYLVKSGEVKTVATADSPYAGAVVGEKYIDFVVNTKDTTAGSGTESHIYLPVNDLVDVYTGGNGIDISNLNVVSIVINPTASKANGLAVTAQGLELNLATAGVTTYVQATGTYVQGTNYYTDSTGATAVDTTGFTAGTTDVSTYYVASTTAGTPGAMSAEFASKLANLNVATKAEGLAMLAEVWGE